MHTLVTLAFVDNLLYQGIVAEKRSNTTTTIKIVPLLGVENVERVNQATGSILI